ncbi:hypothetical protein B0H13DRAFT_2331350 [Mycena leptocephala]|nr:hypothetical protein B0H13DRAFT_2331350 [Mycena leptocephala]
MSAMSTPPATGSETSVPGALSSPATLSICGPTGGPHLSRAQTTSGSVTSPLPTDCTSPCRTRLYHRTRSAYLGTRSVIIIPTARTAVVPLRAVRHRTRFSDVEAIPSVGPATTVQQPSWLKKMVPGAIKRCRSVDGFMHSDGGHDAEDAEDETSPLVPESHPTDVRAFGIRAAKYGGSLITAGIENRPSQAAGHARRMRPISGYFYRVEDDEEELDENMPEVREALRVNAGICAMGVRYEPLQVVQEFAD